MSCSTSFPIPLPSLPITINPLDVHIFSIEESAVNWYILQALNEVGQGSIVQFHTGNASHGGLNRLWIIYIYGVRGTEDMLYTKPVCQTNDSTQISRILHIVQRQAE